MNRRSFLHAFGAGVLGARGSFAIAAAATSEEFGFPILGDLHYDKLEHHDFEWLRATHVGDERQVQNYSRVTREVSPKLLETVKVRAGKANAPISFALQLGDLVEGLCGTERLAEQQMREALAWFDGAALGAPLAMCKGNHDVTGPGAVPVYERLLVPHLQRALNGVEGARFTQQKGSTLVVFYDAYDKASLDWFCKLMEERRPAQLIFVIHPPVVPYNARASWHVFSKPSEAGQRRRLLETLGKHRAFVLCGHLHKYSCLVRRTESGRFLQLAISSVATDPDAKPKDERSGVEAYSPDLVELEPNHSPETEAERRALLAAEKPHILHYDYADTWGHGLMRIGSSGITAEVNRGFMMDAWRSLNLTGLLES